MDQSDVYLTIDKLSTGVYRDRGSKFIGYAKHILQVDNAMQFLAQIKKEHPKARHHCYAYKIGLDGNVFRENDDGEPSGTAGKPIMGQIESNGITNAMIIVVRYFGGKLLGVPGLIKAYKGAAEDALRHAKLIQKTVDVSYQIQCSYGRLSDLLDYLKGNGFELADENYGQLPEMKVTLPLSLKKGFEDKLSKMEGVTFKFLFSQ
jgi:uncharacterized YigZ family protein